MNHKKIQITQWIAIVAICPVAFCLDTAGVSKEKRRVLESRQIYLRGGDLPEWDDFNSKIVAESWNKTFQTDENDAEWTLLIRQVDVRREWTLKLNGKPIGRLKRDENDLLSTFSIPKKTLRSGENQLSLEAKLNNETDDIAIGPIYLCKTSTKQLLSESTLKIKARDPKEPGSPLPCRITIVDQNKSLVPLGINSTQRLAVREGVVYTLDGIAEIPLPAGKYHLFVNRGFEYSQADRAFEIKSGEIQKFEVEISRVVDTKGMVACDTHVHTVTHSGHGDCTMMERMLTLAGEGIELPVATDHNKQIDYHPTMIETETESFFTPLIGNEVTTNFGHFNAFPFSPDATIPNYKENDWSVLIPSILKKPDVKIVILNHARDIHRGYRPFAPENFNDATGQSLNSRKFLFNAMEVINSAAQQSDQFQLFRDWMALTNGGHKILPIGSSDSHDVNKFIVGQGRTYLQVNDTDVANINVSDAMTALTNGRVSVSCGLLTKIKVNQDFGAGDIATTNGRETIDISCQILSPHWLKCDLIQVYENGILVREKKIESLNDSKDGAFKHEMTWAFEKRKHDSFFTILASGPGIMHPSWRLSRPYQPTSTKWNPRIFGFSGAVYIDADGNGRFDCARDYGHRLVELHKQDLTGLVKSVGAYDAAVAAQVAGLFHPHHGNLLKSNNAEVWRQGDRSVKTGFVRFLNAWRKSEQAKVKN